MAKEAKKKEKIEPAELVKEPIEIKESMEGIEEVPESHREWKPTTELGKKLKRGEITDLGEVFSQGYRILEPEIVDILLKETNEELLLAGQAKGKFGGGQRRIFKQTQKKTAEGNRPKFTTCAVIGNKDGYVGVGIGKSKETVPSRDKAKKNAKLNLIQVRRGCGSWECNCRQPHSIPFTIRGKCGSAVVELIPAPKGKGLCIEKECAKILSLAGIKDVWSRASGQTGTKTNVINAAFEALRKLSQVKIRPLDIQKLGIVEGKREK